ncbi:PREDICTED: probable RNA helicase SDE3 [Prunus mume]|uniref:Probable RNA helicase SDE3 n=1 Tax=Prunus mume TaxID=102107 RepID=A0ABM0NF97_PRUMU|nr:PREDICTED: probable RNA helicase SDE3 [Prunus mume]
MSIFLEILKCLFSDRNRSPPLTSTNQSPAFYNYKAPSPPSQPVKSPFSSSSSSAKPRTSSSKPLQSSYISTSSPFPKFPTYSFSSTFPKPPTSSSKLPQSTFVNPSSSNASPFILEFPTSVSKLQQSSSVDQRSALPKPPTSSSKLPQSTLISPSSSSLQLRTPSSRPSPPKLSPSPKFPTYSSSSTFPKPPTSSSKLPQSNFVNPSSSNASPFILEFPTSVSKLQQSSSVDQRSALPKPPTSSSKLPQSTLISPSSLSLQFQTPSSRPSPPKLSTASSKPPQASSKSHSSSPNPPTSSKPSPSSGQPASSTTLPPIFKQVLSPASSDVITEKGKKNYVAVVEKGSLPIFTIPEDFKDLIKNDIVPKVLKQPLSSTTYKDYFAVLLYAEEFYHEKWADFNIKNVTLKLQKAAVYKNQDKEEKTFVELMIDSAPENRPFLLSRDLVYVRPSGTNAEQFQGIINRIIRSNLVLVEFEDEFYDYHYSTQKYDVSFSFNRVCLKRAHQAVQTASDTLFKNFLFPDGVSRTSIPTAPALMSGRHKLDAKQLSAVRQILSIKGSPPYLVAGQLCVERNVFRPSRTGAVVCEAVHQLCQTSLKNTILICAPSNCCCDGIMRSLLKVIPESDMFRANAAFREKDEVPDDILPSCLYEGPCFSCPPTETLKKFRVIFSTLMSSFRLHDKGLTSGHFSHIFLVDASSATEPETAVALTNFAEKSTTVIVTGQPGDNKRWVRADMARRKGLKISYFERLFKSRPYRSLNPMLITQLDQ